jgi:hypothetical protein
MPARPYIALAALFTCIAMTPALAHDADPTYDRINFRVNASQEVENDTLVAVMYYERSGQQPTAMAGDVNRTISQAVDTAKKNGAIKVQTLNYRQEPLYKNQKVVGWKVRQSIRLESMDVTALSTLIGELQQRLSVASGRAHHPRAGPIRRARETDRRGAGPPGLPHRQHGRRHQQDGARPGAHARRRLHGGKQQRRAANPRGRRPDDHRAGIGNDRARSAALTVSRRISRWRGPR